MNGSKLPNHSTDRHLPKLCYLCGRPLSKPTSKDHCPSKALFAKELRRCNVRLTTFRVHERCNSSYHHDEQYFIATMIPFARGSTAGNAIYKERISSFGEGGRNLRLGQKILREFEPRPGGLHLPTGLVIKRQEGDRIRRVAWKIARGLYFHHNKRVLPETFPVGCTMTPPGRRPPEIFLAVRNLRDDVTYGLYPGVFDYRVRTDSVGPGAMNYWAFLFWDRIIMTVYSHDPWSCPCKECTAAIAELEQRAHA